jgi:hypothetical protein
MGRFRLGRSKHSREWGGGVALGSYETIKQVFLLLCTVD